MSDYLIHHGTKGMKWGIRKYQNADGSLTPAGKQRYGHSLSGNAQRVAASIYRNTYGRIGTKAMRNLANGTARYLDKRADMADARASAKREAKIASRNANREAKIASRNAKSEAKVAKANAKAESSKLGFMKRHYIRKAETEAYNNDRKNRIDNAKGIGNKLGEAYGYKNLAAANKFSARMNERQAKTAKGLKREVFENKAYNNKSFARYGDRMAKRSTGQKIVERLTAVEFANTPIKTVYAGRKTTLAKEAVIAGLTFGYGNMVLDAATMAKRSTGVKKKK